MAGWQQQPDAYEVLGLSRDASSADITRAYRRLVRELHPDSHPADGAAADRFHAVTAAHDLLSDPTRRAAHDKLTGHRPVSPAQAARPGASPGRAASQLRPLGPATASGWVLPLSAAAAVRPGPVRIEPLPQSGQASHADAPAGLAELLRLIRQQASDGLYWAW